MISGESQEEPKDKIPQTKVIRLPSVSYSLLALHELQAKMDKDFEVFERAERKANVEQVNEIAKQVEPWTVRAQLDTIMIQKWIRQARRFFSSPRVRMPSFKANLTELKAYAKAAPSKERRAMINDIIGLHEAKKIKNASSAENVIIRLGQRTKDPTRSTRALKEYEQVVGKYRDVEPMTWRLDRASERKNMKHIMVTMILFREGDEDPRMEAQHAKKEITVNVDAPNLAAKRKIENNAKEEIRKTKQRWETFGI
jgi:hypothetical protein